MRCLSHTRFLVKMKHETHEDMEAVAYCSNTSVTFIQQFDTEQNEDTCLPGDTPFPEGAPLEGLMSG